MAKVSFNIVNPLYNECFLKSRQEQVEKYIKQFKDYYSRFDKRLKTTKKKVNVNYIYPNINISIDFNKVHYSQCYNIIENIDMVY